MSDITRRDFLTHSALLGSGLTLGSSLLPGTAAAATKAPSPVGLSWLGDQPPRVPAGVAWGVPWPRGAVSRKANVQLRNAAGEALPAQIWPMAYWPDGSIKWTGLAIAADAQTAGLSVSVGGKAAPKPHTPVTVKEDADGILVDTGPLRARIARSGSSLIASLSADGREVARDGRLLVMREDRSQYDSQGTLREQHYLSKLTRVSVEQSGPVRAVIKLEGLHASRDGVAREWLPFTVRFYFTAGLNAVRMVHSFVFDGDQATDFIKGIGLAFSVPFREETQNRHIRFATDGHNVFAEPVLMAPGYKPKAMANAADYERAQIAGQRIPNLAELADKDQAAIRETPTWDSFKLKQLSADAWELGKRTNAKSSWLHITSGNRARGLAFLGDVSGGLAVGLKHFWQKYPAAFEVSQASAAAGELKLWFWSPDAPAMDLRHYDTIGHSLDVTYEDYQEGHANAYGVANTAELMLWATPDTPSAEALDAMTQDGNAPPLLICAPQHYQATQTLGFWSLPGTPVPGLSDADVAAADTQLDRAFTYFNGEIERRRWYGFWDYGDWRRTYDPIRNQWMYDIGGHGWNATELMPNMWLWFAFLRSGRADIFRAAEDMTRNNNEVDVHHIGPFAGVGSRHNVSHWGDGSKEARINMAALKRFYYYLSTDERTGDLLREPLDTVEKTLASIPPLRKVEPRPDIQPPQTFLRVGPDWFALASNWLAEWERTGDRKYRDWCLTGMKDIGAMIDTFAEQDGYLYDPATKHLKNVGSTQKPSQFMFLFAGDQVAVDLMTLIPCPEFERAWARLCEAFVLGKRSNWYFAPRVTAFAANSTGRQDLQEQALSLYRKLLKFGDQDYFVATPQSFDGPGVTQPALVNASTSTFTPALAVPEVAQWAINLISMPVLLRQFKPRPRR